MKPSDRNLYERVQSSDDSDDQLPPPPPPLNTDPPPSHPHDDDDDDDDSSSENDDNNNPRIQDALKALTSHHNSSPLKKTVMIEIKGKTPPLPPRGKDGVHALTHTEPCRIVPNDNCNPSPNDATPMILFKERLVDTRKLLSKSGTSSSTTTTLDRVKRLQERAGGMVDMRERIQERRDRCFHQEGRLYGKHALLLLQQQQQQQRFQGAGAGAGSVPSSLSLHHDAVAEKPMLQVDAKRDGVLKVSDRSFCENGEIHGRRRRRRSWL